VSGAGDRRKQYPREMIIEHNRLHLVLGDVTKAVLAKDEAKAPLSHSLILDGLPRHHLIALMADACRLVVAMDRGQ
jgi:hypothetical protein